MLLVGTTGQPGKLKILLKRLTFYVCYVIIPIEFIKNKELYNMNYEKIIVELLSRIQTLEEKVDMLMNDKSTGNISVTHEEIVKNVVKLKTKDIRDYIESRKVDAKNNDEAFIVLRASDIHRINRLRNAMPMVCNAMRQCMSENDIVLHETPSGYSSSLEIKYFL